METDEPRVDVIEEEGGRVARLVVNAPPDNALDLRVIGSLGAAVSDLVGWPGLVCVIVEGAGRDFTTGLVPAHRRPPYLGALVSQYHSAIRSLLGIEAVLVSRIRGRCLGAGTELALVSDAVFADGSARIGFPDIDSGAVSPLGTLLLPARIGVLRARQWLLSGRVVLAEEAQSSGLLTELATGWDSLDSIVDRFVVGALLQKPADAVRASVQAWRRPLIAFLDENLRDLEEMSLRAAP